MGKLKKLVSRKHKQREKKRARRSASQGFKDSQKQIDMKSIESMMRKKLVIGNAQPHSSRHQKRADDDPGQDDISDDATSSRKSSAGSPPSGEASSGFDIRSSSKTHKAKKSKTSDKRRKKIKTKPQPFFEALFCSATFADDDDEDQGSQYCSKADNEDEDVDVVVVDDEDEPPKANSPTKSLATDLEELKLASPETSRRASASEDAKSKPLKAGHNNKIFQRMRVAQFRMINEMLYTNNSQQAEKLFEEDEHHFRAYHEGFRKQVSRWSVNPLDIIIREIKKSHSRQSSIADLGCGDAKLAVTLKPLGYTVYSFDFVAINEHVQTCNIRDVPLKSGSVDVAVMCLSLMGTDMGKFVLEANRILRVGGRLMLAEVESRFKSVPAFIKVLKYYGYSLQAKDLTSNRMFHFFNFQKIKSLPKGAENNMLKPLWLKPCLYKKR